MLELNYDFLVAVGSSVTRLFSKLLVMKSVTIVSFCYYLGQFLLASVSKPVLFVSWQTAAAPRQSHSDWS